MQNLNYKSKKLKKYEIFRTRKSKIYKNNSIF